MYEFAVADFALAVGCLHLFLMRSWYPVTVPRVALEGSWLFGISWHMGLPLPQPVSVARNTHDYIDPTP